MAGLWWIILKVINGFLRVPKVFLLGPEIGWLRNTGKWHQETLREVRKPGSMDRAKDQPSPKNHGREMPFAGAWY